MNVDFPNPWRPITKMLADCKNSAVYSTKGSKQTEHPPLERTPETSL
jgi:hypothetical protein